MYQFIIALIAFACTATSTYASSEQEPKIKKFPQYVEWDEMKNVPLARD